MTRITADRDPTRLMASCRGPGRTQGLGENCDVAFVKRLLVGRPLATTEQEHQRIPKTIALAVFSSDAISSTAYATEEILFVIAVGGSSLALGLNTLVPIAIAVAILLAIVVTSYRQTIFAYPSGGGSLHRQPREPRREPVARRRRVAARRLHPHRRGVDLGRRRRHHLDPRSSRTSRSIASRSGSCSSLLITLANLRGVKESGRIFAVPDLRLHRRPSAHARRATACSARLRPHRHRSRSTRRRSRARRHIVGGTLGLFLLLQGFSSGAVALTGVEAISNGVPAFRRPESKNAATTLVWMGVILGTLFFGVSVLAHHLAPVPERARDGDLADGPRGLRQRPVLYVVLQFATAAILTLAANTAYADFPRLSSIIARDGYLPRQFANRGDRLVFSNGVLVLAGVAALLIVAFGGMTNALIPLYAVGVFTSFTLSQAGMVRHHQTRAGAAAGSATSVINGVGSVATGIVAARSSRSRSSPSGAWVPIVVIPLIMLLLQGASSATTTRGRRPARSPPDYEPRRMNHTVVVLVGRVHRGVLKALAYAKSLRPNHLVAVYVVSDDEEQERIEAQWEEFDIDVPLEIVYSPYRELTRPILRYIDELDARWDNDIVTVVIPEFVVGTGGATSSTTRARCS